MTYEPRDIRQIKLVTGDELLTEIVGEDQMEFLIRNPLHVHKERMIIKGSPKEANFFTRWMSFADGDEFIIDKRHVVTEGIVDDAVAEHYNTLMHNIEQLTEVNVSSEIDEEKIDQLSKLFNEEDGDEPTYH